MREVRNDVFPLARNFLFLLPLAVPLLVSRAGVARTVGSLAVVTAAFAAVTAPFYFYDP